MEAHHCCRDRHIFSGNNKRIYWIGLLSAAAHLWPPASVNGNRPDAHSPSIGSKRQHVLSDDGDPPTHSERTRGSLSMTSSPVINNAKDFHGSLVCDVDKMAEPLTVRCGFDPKTFRRQDTTIPIILVVLKTRFKRGVAAGNPQSYKKAVMIVGQKQSQGQEA